MVPAAALVKIGIGTITAGVVSTSAIIGSIIVNLAISALLGKLLAPDAPKTSKNVKGIQNIIRSNIAPRRIIYGEAMCGGPYALIETSGDGNEYLNMIVVVAGHPIEDFLGVTIEDQYVDISGNTNGNTNDDANDLGTNYFVDQGKFGTGQAANHVKIIKNLGWGYADYQYVIDDTATHVINDRERGALIANQTWTPWTQPATTARDSTTGLYTDSGFKLTNCAHIFLSFKFNRDVWSGFPRIKFHVKGKRLYNPQLDSSRVSEGADSAGTQDVTDPDTWEWSEDWTLAVLDYLLNKSYGLAAKITGTLTEVHWAEAIQSYLDSSENIPTGADSPWTTDAARYTINGILETSSTPISNMEALLTSGAGELVYAQGAYKIRPGIYRWPDSPDDIINEDMLRSGLSIRTHTPRGLIFNKSAGVYTDKGYDPSVAISTTNKPKFEPTDFGIVDPLDSSGTNPYEVADEEEIIREFDFPFTTWEYEAQRLARIQLERARQGMTISFEGNLKVLRYAVGDTVYLEILSDSVFIPEAFYNRLGLDGAVQNRPDSPGTAYYKQFKIVNMDYTENSTILVSLVEESEEIYEWNNGYANTTEHALESGIVADDPTGTVLAPSWVVNSPFVALEESTATESGTTVTTLIRWSGADRGSTQSAIDRSQISYYRIEYGIITDPSLTAPANVQSWIEAGTKVGDHDNITQGPIALETLYKDGVEYDFRVQAITYSGRASAWAYYSIDTASTYNPSAPPASSNDFYYIRPLNGTSIQNGSGTLSVEARQIIGGVDSAITSGTIQLYEGSVLVDVNSPGNYPSPSDGYTGTLGTAEISGSATILLKDGPAGTPYDSITLLDVTDGADGENGSNALNAGRTMDNLDSWYSTETQSITLTDSSPTWTVEDITGTNFPKAFQIVNNDDTQDYMFSNRFPVNSANKYRMSVWARQTAGDRNCSLLACFYDSAGNKVTTGTTGWLSVSTYNFWGIFNSDFPGTWTQYTFEFGGDSGVTLPTGATACAIGSWSASSGTTETTVQYQDYYCTELGGTGSAGADGAVGWGHDLIFSSTDLDTVAWTGGTIWTAAGATFPIDSPGSNTGTMSTRTYIYFDGDSPIPTTLSTTTTPQTAVGLNKILIAVAENTTTEAFYQVFGGYGGLKIAADEIAANSIISNNIAASFYTGRTFTGGVFQTRDPLTDSPYSAEPRAVIQEGEPQLAVYANVSNEDVPIFSVVDNSGVAEISILGDFVAGSLDSGQMFSSAGIEDLRGRLGVTTGGGGTGGIATTSLPLTLPISVTNHELDIDIYNTGLTENTLSFTFSDFGFREGSSDNPYTAPTWSLEFFYSTGSPHSWTAVPSGSFSITGTTNTIFDPEIPWYTNTFNLSATRQVNWTPASPFSIDDPIYYMIQVSKTSGDHTSPKLTALAASEAVSAAAGSNSFETWTVTDTDSGSWDATGSIVAESATDTVTLVSGTDIDIDVDTTNDRIRISSTAALPSGTTTDSSLRWSGSAWVENTTVSGTTAGQLRVEASAPIIAWRESDSGADEKLWYMGCTGVDQLILQTRTDAGAAGEAIMKVSRTGTALSSTEFGGDQHNFYSGDLTHIARFGRNVSENFRIEVNDERVYLTLDQDETDTTPHSMRFDIESGNTGLREYSWRNNDSEIMNLDALTGTLTTTANVNGTHSIVADNDSNGTANASRFHAISGDENIAMFVAGSGRTSALVTNGPTGRSAALRTLGAAPISIATSNTERIRIADTLIDIHEQTHFDATDKIIAAFGDSTSAGSQAFGLSTDIDHGILVRSATAGDQVGVQAFIADGTRNNRVFFGLHDNDVWGLHASGTTNPPIFEISTFSETLIDAEYNGAARLFYNNVVKIATESGGIGVTGTVDASGEVQCTYVQVESGGLFLSELSAGATDRTNYGQIYTKNTSPQELFFVSDDGVEHHVAGGSLSETFGTVLVTPEEWTSDTGLSNTALSIAVSSGVDYSVTMVLELQCTSATPDFKFDFSIPGGSTGSHMWWTMNSGGSSFISQGASTSWTTDQTGITVPSSGIAMLYLVGTFKAGADGNFILRGAQNTSNINTTFIRNGSSLMLIR